MVGLISMRKSLLSTTPLTDFRSSEVVDYRAAIGWGQMSRLGLENKALQACRKWRKKDNSREAYQKAFGNHNAYSYGNVRCKAQFSGGDTSSQTASVTTPPAIPASQPQIGSPLLWIGVGVGISIVFSWVARRVQGYAMQQALKSMMQQTGQGGNPFVPGLGSNPISGPVITPFRGSAPGAPLSSPSSSPISSSASATVDVMPQMVSTLQSEADVALKKAAEVKKSAFTDVDVSLLAQEDQVSQEPFSQSSGFPKPPVREPEVVDNNASFPRNEASTGGKGKAFISIEMLETMLDDPKIQQMVFPYLPAEMRDPTTFKQMIQLPQVRQQLQEALNNMGGEDGLDMLKYMNSDVVKQQFEQIGMTPEEVVGKILASPDIAASLQNPKVVEAIMDCSQNPLNITKYQHDTEVMNALMKIAGLFPGATGSPN